MNKINILIVFLFTLGLFSCKSKVFDKQPVGKQIELDKFVGAVEQIPLAQVYFEHGNFINTRDFPPIIKAQDVLENSNQYIIIDLRGKEAYEQGHINGAYNVDKKDVLDFLKNKVKASSAKKVVFVCFTGQIASYVTGITRFAGFDNTYVMLYGMAGWNSEFSAPLKNGFGNVAPANLLVVNKEAHTKEAGHHSEAAHEEHHAFDYGKLPKNDGILTELISKRAQELLALDRPQFLFKAKEFFDELKKDPNRFYTIAYMKKNQYDYAHVKGAHQYTPRKDISPAHKLGEIPLDKDVVIYCKSGHTAGNTSAMLRMLGYKSYSIILGLSSFMHKLWAEQGWQVKDVNALINDFPVVRGKKRTNSNPFIAKKSKKAIKIQPVVKRKKKEVSGGCG